MKKNRKLLALFLVLALLLALAGCGAKSAGAMNDGDPYYEAKPEGGYITDNGYEIGETTPAFDPGKDPGSAPPEGRKWIITARLDAETEDLSQLLPQVTAKVAACGGYTESQNLYSRSASLTVRIPAERLDEFLSSMDGISNVTYSSRSMEDVTLTYVATDSRVKALQTEETRLLELLEKAESLTDILAIEDRLTDVRWELESAASQLRVLGNQVDYATVHLSLDEVRVYTPAAERTLGQRIVDGFKENLSGVGRFLEDFLVWLLTGIPVFVLLAVVIVPCVLLIRRARRKRAERKSKKDGEG